MPGFPDIALFGRFELIKNYLNFIKPIITCCHERDRL